MITCIPRQKQTWQKSLNNTKLLWLKKDKGKSRTKVGVFGDANINTKMVP
jgi:hypothetical protein